jgi:GST-like protein
MTVTLYGHPGWGSTIVEAQLAWLGIDFTFEEVGDLYASSEARAALRRVNPLAQVPTLVLEDGQILTESAAITLYLADRTGRNDFVPAPQSPERAQFLRWLVFIVANVYAVATFSDEPERFVPMRRRAPASGLPWTTIESSSIKFSSRPSARPGSWASGSARSTSTSR